MLSIVRGRLATLGVQLAFCGMVLACIWGLSRASQLVPSPPALGNAFVELVSTADFYVHLGTTLYEAFIGLSIAALLGVSTGIAIGASRTAMDFVQPIILSLYSIPKIIFLPVLLIIFGPGLSAKIANAAVHALFPILLNTIVGMREIDLLHLRVARSMLATRRQTAIKVYAPSMALPVLTGIRLGSGLAFMGALLAELFEANAGIGYLVNQLYSKGLIAQMLSTIFAMFLLILLINAGLQAVQNRMTRWRTE